MFSQKNLIILSIIIFVVLVVLYKVFFTSLDVIGYKIIKQDALNGITATGVVASQEDVDVAPDTTSVIVKKLYKEGEFVKKGQILAYLDKNPTIGQLETAKGNYKSNYYALKDLQTEPRLPTLQIAKEQLQGSSLDINIAEGQVIKAEAKLKDAKLEQTKFEMLYNQGAISLRDFEKSQYSVADSAESLRIAQQQLNSARINQNKSKQNYLLVDSGTKNERILAQKGNLEAAKGGVTSALSEIDSKTIKAPVNGYISDKFLNLGEVASPTKPIVRILNLNSLYIRVAVDEADIENIKVGQKAIIVFDAYPKQIFDGKVFDVIKSVNNITGTFDVKVHIFPKKNIKTLPGMTSDVTIVTEKIKNAVIVPRKYIYEENGYSYVYTFNKGKAEKKKVKILSFDNSRVIIETPLAQNSLVLYNEKKKLKNNIKVKVIEYDTIENANGRLN